MYNSSRNCRHDADQLHRLDPRRLAEASVADLVENLDGLFMQLGRREVPEKRLGRLRQRFELNRGEVYVQVRCPELRDGLARSLSRLLDDASHRAAVTDEAF